LRRRATLRVRLPVAEGGSAVPGAPESKTTTTPPGLETERITVALVPKAAADLQYLLRDTGLSKTDLVNRALTLYKFVQESITAGREVIVRDKATGEDRVVMFF
jgi:hypothetical protein